MADVEDRDFGFRRIVTNLKSFDGVELVVGVLRNAGREKDGTDLVDVAFWNEFGTRHIPSRPFVRIATDEHGDEWQKLAEKGLTAITEGRMSRKQVLDLVGLRAKADVQKVFGDKTKLKSNSEKTIAKKGSSAPLIDSASLRDRGVNYRIDE